MVLVVASSDKPDVRSEGDRTITATGLLVEKDVLKDILLEGEKKDGQSLSQ
ncbi:MAG TPA: hypothetical protein GX502_03020 [Syntrophaceticus sp.]|nr:hypothetical protein [Syntrophaceticus sp.]